MERYLPLPNQKVLFGAQIEHLRTHKYDEWLRQYLYSFYSLDNSVIDFECFNLNNKYDDITELNKYISDKILLTYNCCICNGIVVVIWKRDKSIPVITTIHQIMNEMKEMLDEIKNLLTE